MLRLSAPGFLAFGAGAIVFAGHAVAAQPNPVTPRAQVQGTVFDSLAGTPLIGALVQLVALNDTVARGVFGATTDSSGAYRLANLPAGVYVAGFLHMAVDTMGLEPVARTVNLRTGAQRLDLATPSPRTVHREACGPVQDDRRGLLIGHVRRTETGAPATGAQVRVEWREVSDADPSRLVDRVAEARTGEGGAFGLCGVAGELAVLAQAMLASDSSGVISLQIPSGGVRHVTFYVGDAPGPGLARTVSGVVHDERGAPVSNARVSAWGTELQATSDERGSFTLAGLRGGTRTVEVQAIGFVPVRRIAHVAAEESRRLEVMLERVTTELPVVSVRERAAEAKLLEFERHRRLGLAGHFLAPRDLAQRPTAQLSQMLLGLPGLDVRCKGGDCSVIMFVPPGTFDEVAAFGGRKPCSPTLYVDGLLHAFEFAEFNRSFEARDLVAVEVYPRPSARPAEFIDMRNNCGVIAVWTKEGRPAR